MENKRITGPFEDERDQVKWQREVLMEEYENKDEKHEWIRRIWR